VADPARVAQVLGWKAKRPLNSIVETAWRWLQNRSRVRAGTPR